MSDPNNLLEFPANHAQKDKIFDAAGYQLSNAASRITPLAHIAPVEFCLDLTPPGARRDTATNIAFLSGTEKVLKRVRSCIVKIQSGRARTDNENSAGEIMFDNGYKYITRHANSPKWLIQCLDMNQRPWFLFTFCDKTADEIVTAIDNYDFRQHD